PRSRRISRLRWSRGRNSAAWCSRSGCWKLAWHCWRKQRNSLLPISPAPEARNGLMVALLALCPIRLKNFAGLEIGRTFKEVHGSWWIALPAHLTKSRRPDERRVPALLNRFVELYLSQSRPLLLKSSPATNALWISSTTGGRLTTKNLGTLISKITLETIGVDVSPHLFRAAAASTAAAYGGDTPPLASAVLNHTDPRLAEEHYNPSTSIGAGRIYAEIISSFRHD